MILLGLKILSSTIYIKKLISRLQELWYKCNQKLSIFSVATYVLNLGALAFCLNLQEAAAIKPVSLQ